MYPCICAHFIYTVVKVDGSPPKRWIRIRGHDKPRLMGVAIAIDPFQVVYIYTSVIIVQVEAGDLVTFPDGMTCVTWWDGYPIGGTCKFGVLHLRIYL